MGFFVKIEFNTTLELNFVPLEPQKSRNYGLKAYYVRMWRFRILRIFNYHDIISIRVDERNIVRVSNVAKTCPFFVDYEAQKVSLRLVSQEIQLYLDSSLAVILINTHSNTLHARAAALAMWVNMRVINDLFCLSNLRLVSQTIRNT